MFSTFEFGAILIGELNKHPVTPDGRYFVVQARLWRCTNPALDDSERERLTLELMEARRSIRSLRQKRQGDLSAARDAVDRAKIALGERGPVWWTDGALDYNRKLVRNTPYAEWYSKLKATKPLTMDADP